MQTQMSEIKFGKGYLEFYHQTNFKHIEHDAKLNDPFSFFELAEFWRNSGDLKKAQPFYKKAYDNYEQWAKMGEPTAFYYLGYFHQYGYGAKEDKHKAEFFYAKAFELLIKFEGNARYYYYLGRLFESGFTAQKKLGNNDFKKAAHYYGLAAAMNYRDAYYRLGFIDAMQK